MRDDTQLVTLQRDTCNRVTYRIFHPSNHYSFVSKSFQFTELFDPKLGSKDYWRLRFMRKEVKFDEGEFRLYPTPSHPPSYTTTTTHNLSF